ncbi:MAG: type II secretion system GspH family protein [Heliobacteriaceae bacterium]|jgi:prepilin-type N-terminal cleavage/methylation domain-containing protein|nr:type II secretion system GspH family protein [Heliobacteriaceae bacterium]
MKKCYERFAFTLAEVLITLGVIGVVAALTMPALISNYRRHITAVKLKKIYTVMNQAINMSMAHNGPYENWYQKGFTSIEDAEDWFEEYIGKYLNIVKITNDPDPCRTDGNFLIYFPDGSILRASATQPDYTLVTDVKALNSEISRRRGYNEFVFRFDPFNTAYQAHYKKGFEPQDYTANSTREQLITGCQAKGGAIFNEDCTENIDIISNNYCTKLIQLDGWEIKDDYPVKF